MEVVDQIVGNQCANNADQHHGKPIGGGNIFPLRKLPDQCDRQNEAQPGMPVEVYVKPEERTPPSFLVKPFTDQVMRIFRQE